MTLCEYKLLISDYYTDDITRINQELSAIPAHPNILIPYCATVDDESQLFLHYNVNDTGLTLKQFIHSVNTTKVNIRKTIYNALHRIQPTVAILQLIEIYEFMIASNMLIGKSNVNPDNIWVEREHNGKLKISVIYTAESIIDNKFRNNSGRNYWSAETMNEYNNITYYNYGLSITKPALTRNDTRPTPISIVYSLGLILYFMVEGHDAFEEHRIDVYEMPHLSAHVNPIIARLITSATDTNYRTRPSLAEWKRQFEHKKSTCILI
jgi:hypothetical protein